MTRTETGTYTGFLRCGKLSTPTEWKQPELEQAASEFLWEKYLSNDPLKMYVAFRIWNSYLLAREPRDRNAACDRFMIK